jgi:hypothetical protein
MPPGVADVLLYRVRPAVDALEKLQAGFPDPGPDGSPRRDTDAGSLLRALRNATHSYRSTVGDPRHVLLLARHSGEIPDALADLALLQLLAFLRDPFLPTTSVKGARSASRKR